MASGTVALPALLPGLDCRFERLEAGDPPVHRAQVTTAQWRAAASAVRAQGGRLISVWGVDRADPAAPSGRQPAVAVTYGLPAGLVWLDLALEYRAGAGGAAALPGYPDLSATFPAAARLQRAVADLSGLQASGAADARPWLQHGAWPRDYYPLRHRADRPSGAAPRRAADADADADADNYPFVAVEGDGVHEIAVGPVHAGIIEPGHFRFSVVGEKILRLEERLGYVHKGIEQRFAGADPLQGARLAARVSGDSTVAYGWAYCAAVEALFGVAVPPRARWLRALALERERVANHLGDVGALGNDAGFGAGLAQFSRLREDWLRRNREAAGHRLLMDWIVPGGMAADLDAAQLQAIGQEAAAMELQVGALEAIYDAHAGLQDRFAGTGHIDGAQARALGLTGMAARASGAGTDLREAFGSEPYAGLGVRVARAEGGDVGARVAVRFAEIHESLRLIGRIARELPGGAVHAAFPGAPVRRHGAGWIEGWRGEILVTVELDGAGRIARAHCHDPSWQNWPALAYAVIGNIVPDFPLINKSFNLSYSGQDL